LDEEKSLHQDLYISPALRFLGINSSKEEADYLLLGVPYDGTSTHRPGSRFAPNAIREASKNLETVSLRSGVDLENVKIHDLGDLDVASSLDETLRRLELVIKESRQQGKFQVSLGGEHAITLGAVRAWGSEIGILDFDAHMDLRDEYQGARLSHATFMRRIAEEIGAERIVQVGVRAACQEELRFAAEEKIRFFTSYDLSRSGVASTAGRIRREIKDFEKIYLTVDADVLDPSFAPAVGNPEPEGISTTQLIELLCGVLDHRIVAMDLVEVSPVYDSGATAAQVCKVLFEIICLMEKMKRHR